MRRWVEEGVLVDGVVVAEAVQERCSRRDCACALAAEKRFDIFQSGRPRICGVEQGWIYVDGEVSSVADDAFEVGMWDLHDDGLLLRFRHEHEIFEDDLMGSGLREY